MEDCALQTVEFCFRPVLLGETAIHIPSDITWLSRVFVVCKPDQALLVHINIIYSGHTTDLLIILRITSVVW